MTPLDALRTLPTEDDVPTSTRARVFNRVLVGLAAPPGGSSALTNPSLAVPTAKALGSGKVMMIALGSAVLGAVLALSVSSFVQRLRAPTAMVRPALVVTTNLPLSATLSAPAKTETAHQVSNLSPLSAPRVGTVNAANTRLNVAPKPLTLKAERQLLDDARERAVAGDFNGAKQLIETHRRRFVSGKLIEERDALAITVLVKSGDTSTAKQQASKFKETYPNSFMLPAIDAAIGSVP